MAEVKVEAIIKLTLDTSRENRVQEPVVVQDDYGARFIDVTMTTMGVVQVIPSTAIVLINATRADGASDSFQGEVNADGTVRVPINQWMTALDDRVTYTVSAVTDSRLSTTPSTFLVKASPNRTDTPSEGTEEADLLATVLYNENVRQTAEEQRVSAETRRFFSENTRITNEFSRESAETQRLDNEAERVEAEATRESKFNSWEADIASLPSFDARITANSKRISNIYAGLPADRWAEDSTVAYQKDVPSSALPCAAVSKIGGMTYKDETDGTLKDAKVTAIKSVGVNLFDVNNINYIETYINQNGDFGSLMEACKTIYVPCQPNTIYTVSKIISARFVVCISNTLPMVGGTGYNVVSDYSGTTLTVTTDSAAKYIVAWVYNSQYDTISYEEIIQSLQIQQGEVATPYKPYKENIVSIPEAVQDIDGWGQGIPNTEYYNFVDWRPEDGVTEWHKIVGAVDLGTFDWSLSAYDYWLTRLYGGKNIKCLGNSVKSNIIAELYETIDGNSIQKITNTVALLNDTANESTKALYIACNNGSTTEKPSGMLYYELYTPEVTDISDILPADNLIEVEGGGTLTFVNEYGYDVPSTVTYQLDPNAEEVSA